MRYRRYYTSRRSDGSRVVVSYGPLMAIWNEIARFLILAFIWFLPPALLSQAHREWATVLGWVLEVPWVFFVIYCRQLMIEARAKQQHRQPPKRR